MVAAEIFISAALQVLFERLTPHARSLWDLARRQGLEKKLEMLEKLFRRIGAVLADAEEKQLSDEAVQLWLDDLKELSYHAEDVLDEFAYEALRRKVCAKQRAAFTPSSLKFRFKMGSKIDDISSRLEEISKLQDQLGLEKTISNSSARSWQTPTTALPNEADIYGRKEDKAKIKELLLLTNERNYDVIPIVGMGGTGKTTLIQHLYRDKEVEEAFKTKAWVCVSDDFEPKRIMKGALEDLTRKPCQLMELQPIQDELARILAGKRFLLVLDDMWDYTFSDNKWSALTSLFRVGARGSKVVVTTREREVASKVCTIAPHTLNILSDDDCWLLFKTHVPKIRDVDMNPDLELLRKKINERCKGLPLAARILGCLIARKPWDKWQDVIDNKIWIEDKEDGILPVLKLSYHYLPQQLKKCFTYCAILPQDYGFTEKELVRLWAAEGLIQQADGNKHVYEVGSMYFHELVSRSIFLPLAADHDSQFIMHDLVHELAQQVAGDTCLRLETILEHGEAVLRARHGKEVPRAHHLHYPRSRRIDSIKKSVLLPKENLVRTFLSLQPSYYNTCCLTNNVLHQLLKLKKLRVLSLSGYNITELPCSIGDLKHLRYLDLSRTEIIYLPETTCSLYNLQTLLLVHCHHLKKLPSKMENLINLCYLDIMGCLLLNEMPIGLKELKSLQELPNFLVSKGDGYCGVQGLMNLKDLRGTLCISYLKDVVDANDASAANLKEKKLDALILDWGHWSDELRVGNRSADVRNIDTEKRVLDMLQPHQNIKELTIKNYAGNVFSKWLGDPSLISSMTLLKLEFCKKCTCLPPLGQFSSLKVLEIRGMEAIQSVGAEFYGSTQTKIFPSLESLTFDEMPEWENWTCCEVSHKQVEIFPCLSEFYLHDCPKLSGMLPNHLPLLKKLNIEGCEKLNDVASSFPELCELQIFRCQEFGGSTIQLGKVEYLKIDGDGCEELISRNLPCTVEDLSLINCTTIEKLPITLCKLKNLRKLFIENCSNLVSLPNALLCSSVLEEISIKECDKLQSLVNEVEEDLIDSESLSASVLKKLKISDCEELEFVAKTLPASLRTLEIWNCNALKFVAETFLEDTMLESITVTDCENFERLPEGLNSLSHLQAISMWCCDNFLSFPQGGLPSTNLTKLKIWDCENLEALPNGMCNLTSLRCLKIVDCSLINNFVPAEGFLANVVKLRVGGDNILRPLKEWGFDRLTCLEVLTIIGCEDSKMIEINFPTSLTSLAICDFPMLVTLPPSLPISLTRLDINRCPMLVTLPPSLPISLTSLYIDDCQNLEYLSKSSNYFQNLTSLETLWIIKCPKLKSLPMEGLPPSLKWLDISGCEILEYLSKSSNCFQKLTSLERLVIWSCPKLKSLPKEGLPPSLLYLDITLCPMLVKRCRRDKGKDWPNIANIPEVYINGQRPKFLRGIRDSVAHQLCTCL